LTLNPEIFVKIKTPETGAIDKQIRSNLTAIFHDHMLDKATLSIQVYIYNRTLGALDTTRLGILSQILRIQPRIKMIGVVICGLNIARVPGRLVKPAIGCSNPGHGIFIQGRGITLCAGA